MPVYPGAMHAVTIVDGSLRWLEHPDPRPGPGELLVAVEAAGINAADLMQRQGLYPAPPGYPVDIPGMELAGEVVALGPGTSRWSIGDRVMSITGGGAQAELAVIPEGTAMAVPDGIAWDQAGGFPEVFCTAYDALFTQAGLVAGERVLISGAAGGVGTAAVQLAHAAGAYVVASVRSVARHHGVRDLGADEVIQPDQVPDHGPYDVSLELVGARWGGCRPSPPGHGWTGGRHRCQRLGGQGRTEPAGPDGSAGDHRRVDPPGADGGGEVGRRPRRRGARGHPARTRARSWSRWPSASPWPGRPRPTSGLRAGGKFGKIVLVK